MTNMMDEGERGDIEPTLRDADEVKEGGDLEPSLCEAFEKVRQRRKQLHCNARATYRAMEGWQRVRSEEDWVRINEEARKEYESGGFLLERLGAQRHLDPKLMATLGALRQTLIAEWGITTVAEMMLVDLAVVSYYHALRVQGWIGDLSLYIEHEFFGEGAFAANRAQERAVEERAQRLGDQLMPLFDRANRTLIRNLKAIKELRQGLVPAIAIGRAEHVTVTNQQNGRAPLRPVKRDEIVEMGAREDARAAKTARSAGAEDVTVTNRQNGHATPVPEASCDARCVTPGDLVR